MGTGKGGDKARCCKKQGFFLTYNKQHQDRQIHRSSDALLGDKRQCIVVEHAAFKNLTSDSSPVTFCKEF